MEAVIPHEVGAVEQFQNKIAFLRNFPTGRPVFVTCSYSNHGDVEMLVIPEYYSFGGFKCLILAINAPLLPPRHAPKNESWDTVTIGVEQILAWRTWSKGEPFLTFGNGYITERYLNMVFN